MRREDQQRILSEVQARTEAWVLSQVAGSGQPLDEILAESVFQAQHRLHSLPPRMRRRKNITDESLFWQAIARRLGRANAVEQSHLLAQVMHHYATQVCGNFNIPIYRLVRQTLPPMLGVLLNASSPKRLLNHFPEMGSLDESIVLQGATEHLRRLHEMGTVILAPTHVSNLDPVLLAFAIFRLSLPPFIYGAARDLFSNWIVGFFLNHLGAYTIDRRNHDPLYQQVLLNYATLTLEYGYDNLFFPSISRSRSGSIIGDTAKIDLDLDLIGTSIPAYIYNLQRGAPRPKIFIVPATLSYQLVLEAETLIDDFLRDVGQSRYIITDDEFSKPRRVYDFMTQLFALDSKIFITFGTGHDPFGNLVDDHGESLDPCGRRIDCRGYVLHQGVPKHVPKRDIEYTRDLGHALRKSYMRDTVIQATHVTARALFGLLRVSAPKMDLLRLIRVGAQHEGIHLRYLYAETKRLMQLLRLLSDTNRLRLAPFLNHADIEDIVSDGLRHFAIYHRVPAAQRRGDKIIPRDRSLLFYYQNSLDGYGLEYPS